MSIEGYPWIEKTRFQKEVGEMTTLNRIWGLSSRKVLIRSKCKASRCGMPNEFISKLESPQYVKLFYTHLVKENNKFSKGILLKR